MPAKREPLTLAPLRAFADELRAWREQAGLTKAELSRELRYTSQYVGQVEDCKNLPSRKFAEDCDAHFTTNGVFQRLWKTLSNTRRLAYLPKGFPEYLERERRANTMKIFSPMLVHGLFQTQETINAIMSTASDGESASGVAEQRVERQRQVFDRVSPPTIFLVLDEGILYRRIGSKEDHRDQLRHLLTLAERAHVMVQIVPQDCGYYPGLTGGFIVLTLEDGSRAAYTESAGSGVFVDEPGQTAEFDVRFDMIRGRAKSHDESLIMIRKAMENL
ncbi:helix-turn-helix protein [Actinocorallia herbida]|uniref:Helix-turn-helix protein n=2 Tax=Actinocorallia herbida TaxID=58109 RepID=A0A3N1CPC8_9ACTN|nr:helix-turn-helix protein [Actinocorallia herbida]